MKIILVHGLTILLMILLMIPGWQIFGQKTLNDTIHIKEIAIQAKVPISSMGLQKLDSLELAQHPGETLSTLLAEQSPVYIHSAAPGSLASVSMRGTLASHTRVTWNGIPLNSPMIGQVDFSLLPTFFADQIQLVSGPAALQAGSGGLGGNIEISSFGRWDKPFFGSLLTSIGSFDTYRIMAEAGGGSSAFQIRVRAFHQESKNDFPFLNTANGLFNEVHQQNADFLSDGVLVQSFWRPDSNQLFSIQAWGQQNIRNIPPIMSYAGKERTEYQADESIRISSAWQLIRGNIQLKVNSGVTQDDLEYFLAHSFGGNQFINQQSESRSNSWFNQAEGAWNITPKYQVSVHIQGNFHRVDIADQKTSNGYQADRKEMGIRLKFSQQWSEQCYTYQMIRHDRLDALYSPLLPVVGIAYVPLPGFLELSSSAGKNFHAPTLNDLYWIPGGNPNLQPEESALLDVKAKVFLAHRNNRKIQVDMTGFITRIDHLILWKPGDFHYWTPENLDGVLARGVESSLTADFQWLKWHLKLRSDYSFTRTSQENTGMEIPPQLMYIPKHKGNTLVHLSTGCWHFQYHFSHVSKRNTGTGAEAEFHQLPAYSLHHLGVGRKIRVSGLTGDMRLKVNNLANTHYQTILWRAMPGRSFTLSLNIDF